MKRLLFSLLLVIPIVSLAQSNYHKGYVVTNSNDTLKGYVDYRERSVNPATVNFETELNGKAQVFNLSNCLAYGIDDIVSYQRFLVDITMSKVNVSDLSRGIDLKSKKGTVFLNVLQAGKNVTLFSYRDVLKTRYYLLEKGSSEPYELVRQIFLKKNEPSVSITDKEYQKQLLAVMKKFGKDDPSSENSLSKLSYTAASILKVVSVINEVKEQEVQVAVRTKVTTNPNARFFMGTGLNLTRITYSSNNSGDIATKSKNSYFPLLTAGVDLFANPAIGKLIYRIEASLLMGKSDVSTVGAIAQEGAFRQKFDQFSLALAPQVIYNIYNTDKLKFFIGAGLGINISNYSHNEVTVYDAETKQVVFVKEPGNFKSFYFSYPVTTGVVLNKKVELFAGYALPSTINHYKDYSIAVQRYKLGVSYLFGKH